MVSSIRAVAISKDSEVVVIGCFPIIGRNIVRMKPDPRNVLICAQPSYMPCSLRHDCPGTRAVDCNLPQDLGFISIEPWYRPFLKNDSLVSLNISDHGYDRRPGRPCGSCWPSGTLNPLCPCGAGSSCCSDWPCWTGRPPWSNWSYGSLCTWGPIGPVAPTGP